LKRTGGLPFIGKGGEGGKSSILPLWKEAEEKESLFSVEKRARNLKGKKEILLAQKKGRLLLPPSGRGEMDRSKRRKFIE